MVSYDNYIVGISSWFSMIGSSFVALTTLYPVENRKKVGKTLLFWLSLSDFFTSLVYFVQTCNQSGTDNAFCKSIGLLGIFFPVSSFIWTDLIAYYLFSVIVQRNQMDKPIVWESRLKYFHVLAWGIPAIIVAIVGFSDQEGKDADNTWCWIKEEANTSEQFIWEFIGGKCVEWISCFIILPFLYTYAACQLQRIEADTGRPLSNAVTNGISSYQPSSPTTQSKSGLKKSSSSTTLTVLTIPNSGSSSPVGVSAVPENAKSRSPVNCTVVNTSTTKPRLFGRFYLKMAAVPVVFFCIRFWNSLRVVLNYAGAAAASQQWLRIMVDIFDPSQGFFNAVLFVVFSSDGQRSVWLAFSLCLSNCFFFVPGALRLAFYFEAKSARKHPSYGIDPNPIGAGNQPPHFSKYNNNNMTNDLTNPMLASTYSAPGYHSTTDFSIGIVEDEIDGSLSSHSLSSYSASIVGSNI
jgi:hypothetical protein